MMKRKRRASSQSFSTQKASKLPEKNDRQTCFRVKNIPDEVELEDLSVIIADLFQLDHYNVHIHSLAADVEGNTATVSFDEIPSVLKGRRDDLGNSRGVVLPYRSTQRSKVGCLKFDTHFGGFTPLSPKKVENYRSTCIFLHGWGGHAIGSFRSPTDFHVWPRDSLPSRFPEMQIWTYGYGSRLTDATMVGDSYGYAEDLKVHLRLFLRRSNARTISLSVVFVAHSLGGLMLQRAMVRMHKSSDPDDKISLRSISATLFFGVPGNGMDVTALRDMVHGTPHEFELALLDQNAGFQLRINEQEEFHNVLQYTNTEVCNFWERTKTKSLIMDTETGRYKRVGRETLLVTPTPTSCGQDRKQGSGISRYFNRDHFDLVKFSNHDQDCEVIFEILEKLNAKVDAMKEARSSESTVLQLSKHDRQACLQSLYFLGMNDRSEEISAAVQTTCMWIFEAPAYLEWSSRTRGLLWIKGKPGAGKSTVMKHVVKSVTANDQHTEITASFFFHGRGARMQKSPLGLFQSLMHQLASQIPELLNAIAREYLDRTEKCGRFEEKWTWTVADLKDMFQSHVVDVAKTNVIRIFIDALDECGEQEAVALIKFFSDIEKDLSMCFSCRHYPIISLHGKGWEVAVQDNNSKDIITYVARQLQDCIADTEIYRYQKLRKDIEDKASGVFQWVKLVTDIVVRSARQGKDIKAIQRRIKELPPELDDLYHELLGKVDDDDKPQTLKLMQWIYFAKRPLTSEELRIALATDPDMSFDKLYQCKESEHYSKTESALRANILYLSQGLVEFVERDKEQILQFVHQSVIDYLSRRGLQFLHNNGSWAPQGSIAGRSHFRLSRSCVKYLLADEIQSFDFKNLIGAYENPTSGFIQAEVHKKFPLLAYAAHFWIKHCREAEREEIKQDDLVSIWQENTPLPLGTKEICEFNFRDGMWHFFMPKITKLEYLASQFGLGSVMRAIISQDSRVNSEEGWGISLLLHAAEHGYEAVVQVLLNQGSIDPNAMSPDHWTPLTVAASKGKEAVVRLLLKQSNVDRDPIDLSGRTPLSYAAEQGSEAVFNALLQNPNCHSEDWKDDKGRTPLSYAAEGSHGSVVKLLLAQDCVDKNSRDSSGRTPFSWAVDTSLYFNRGKEDVVRTFLRQDTVQKDLPDNIGRTPLSWAASGYNVNVIGLLVGQDCIEKDSRDSAGRTPLSWAAEWSNENAVRLLLDQDGIEKDSRDKSGRTPLSYAAGSMIEGREKIVELLLSYDSVYAGSKDAENRSVFFYACRDGCEGVAKLLAEREDVDVSMALRLDDPLTQAILLNENRKLEARKRKPNFSRRAGKSNRVVSLQYRPYPQRISEIRSRALR